MSMEITRNYGGYSAYSKKSEKASGTSIRTAITSRSEKYAAGINYLDDLKKQIPGTAFFIGTVSYGQTYGSSGDNNFVVDPKYLEKLADDPEHRKNFEESVKTLNSFSNQFRAGQAAQRREVVSEGWFCDENGNWGGWSVTRPTDTRSHLQEMREKSNEIFEKKAKAKLEAQKLAEKRAIEKNSLKTAKTDILDLSDKAVKKLK